MTLNETIAQLEKLLAVAKQAEVIAPPGYVGLIGAKKTTEALEFAIIELTKHLYS